MARELDLAQSAAADKVIGDLDKDVALAYRKGHAWISGERIGRKAESPPPDWQELLPFYDVASGRMRRTKTPVADGWKELQQQAAMVRIHRIPESPEPDWDQLPITWDDDFFKGISARLKRVIPDLDDRRRALVKKLYEINEALTEDAVERMLVAGTCDKCQALG